MLHGLIDERCALRGLQLCSDTVRHNVRSVRSDLDMSAVLLYYKYVDLSDQREAVRAWMLSLCSGLSLKGRIRVGNDGVNVTVRNYG